MSVKRLRGIGIWGSVFGLAVLGGQAPSDQTGDDDPPGRVARISVATGTVSFRAGDADDWSVADVNDPLTTGDALWTDQNSRAEVALADGALRMGPATAWSLLALDDEMTQMRVAQGSVAVRAWDVDDDDRFEIDTPNGAINPTQPGSYRIDVSPNGDSTIVVVRSGEVDVSAGGATFHVGAGQAASIVGLDAPTYDVFGAPTRTALEDWGSVRDRQDDQTVTAHYVPRDVIGYQDLDANGTWETDADLGPVWAPRSVAADWAPYRTGHWRWVRVWGWTWVDDAPWGFAPYHYGRWARLRDRWCWVPGRFVGRPVYAPALVAFVGGSNFGISVSTGPQVGWFPLAPREAYLPGYRVSDRYRRQVNVNVTNVNITNVNVTNINYRNRQVPGGVTVVSQQTFVRAQPVARAIERIDPRRLTEAHVVTVAAVVPTRESLAPRSSDRRPPQAVVDRRVVVRTAPPPPPTRFAAKEAELKANPGRPVERAAEIKVPVRPREPNPFVRTTTVQPAQPARPAPPTSRPADQPARPADRPNNDRPTLRPARPSAPPTRPAEPAPPPKSPTETAEQQNLLRQQAEERDRMERQHQTELKAKAAPDTAARRRLSDEDRGLRQRQRQARDSVRRGRPQEAPRATPPKPEPPRATPPRQEPPRAEPPRRQPADTGRRRPPRPPR